MRIPAWHVALLAHAGLGLTLIGWWLLVPWAETGRPRLAALAILPLLAPLRGLVRHSRYTAAWTSLLLVAYLVAALVEWLAGGPQRGWAFAAFLSAALAFSALLKVARRGPDG